MNIPVVLLVDNDIDHAKLISHSIERLVLTRPIHVQSGEAAVLWVGAHTCDVCLLNYELPDIDGLETLVRIHQRKPDLPVVMMANSESAQVAVEAFHAGVVDYVLKKPGFQDAVAQLVKQVGNSLPARVPFPQLTKGDIPEQLLLPTYQNRLRFIGRQLDLYGYRSVNLLEVSGGFLVRALAPGNRSPEALEFPDRDFPQLVAGAIAMRGEGTRRRSISLLLPTGYEDFLRALGYRLDIQMAEAITVTELDSFIAVNGVAWVEGPAQTRLTPFQTLLYVNDIQDLLEEAVRRRA